MAEALILNDEERPEGHQDQQANQSNGLSGLRERVATLDGAVESGSLDMFGKKHFRLWVALPLQDCAETEKTEEAQEKRA